MAATRRSSNAPRRNAQTASARSAAAATAAATAAPAPARWRWLISLGIAAILIAAGATLLVHWGLLGQPRPVLPSLKRDGMDPVLLAAIEEAEAAVRESPRSGAAWGRLGQVLFVHGIGGPAIESFARAAELSPEDPRWPYLSGRALARENGDLALPHLRRAAAICHGSPAAPSLLLAELLIERGALDEAAAQIDLVLNGRGSSDPRALLDRARLRIAQGRWDEARRDLERSISLAPGVKASHLLLASALAHGGGDDASASAAREARRAAALSDDPRWPDPYLEEMSSLAVGRAALLERAEMLLARGEPKPAITALEALVSRYPDDVAVLDTLGESYRRDGQLLRAEATFRRAVAAAAAGGPDAMAARTGLGLSLCDQRRFADALPPLRECVRLNPNLPATHYNLATCLAGLGDRPGAIAALRDAVRVEPSFREGYVALATLLADSGQPAEATTQLRRALELDPDDPAAAALLRRLDPSAN